MPGRPRHGRSPEHAALTENVDGDDLLRLGVGDVRDDRRADTAGERTAAYVPRPLKALESRSHRERLRADERHRAVGGVNDHDTAPEAAPDELDRARARPGVDPTYRPCRPEIEDDDVALEVRSHERDRRSLETPGDSKRVERERERKCRSCREKAASIHAGSTPRTCREVRGPRAQPRSYLGHGPPGQVPS